MGEQNMARWHGRGGLNSWAMATLGQVGDMEREHLLPGATQESLQVCTAEEWQEWSVVAQRRKAAWNNPEPGWEKLEDGGGETLVDFLDLHDRQLHSSGRLRTEGLNVIPEIIIAGVKGEYSAVQSVDRRILASLDTRQYIAKEN